MDLNPVCLCVNGTNPDQYLDQNPRVNGAMVRPVWIMLIMLCSNYFQISFRFPYYALWFYLLCSNFERKMHFLNIVDIVGMILGWGEERGQYVLMGSYLAV